MTELLFKSVTIGEFEAGMVVEGKIILELKAVSALHPKHTAQAINYLAATGLQPAILLNFGAESLEHERVIRHRTNSRSSMRAFYARTAL
jgi:GxxExxY protein